MTETNAERVQREALDLVYHPAEGWVTGLKLLKIVQRLIVARDAEHDRADRLTAEIADRDAEAMDLRAERDRLAAELGDTTRVLLAQHQPMSDGPLGLITWTYCSCGAYSVRDMPDGATIAPVAYAECPARLQLLRESRADCDTASTDGVA